MSKAPSSMEAGDNLARALIPAIKQVARALPRVEQQSFLLGFIAHFFGFLAARYGVQMALELIDKIQPIVKRMEAEQEHIHTRH